MVKLLLFQLGFATGEKHQCFQKHETSHSHSEALLKLSSKENIASQLDNVYKKEQKLRRKALMKQLSSLRYLMWQGLHVRS